MRLANPGFLFLLLFWIPMIWIYLYREKRTQPAVRYSDISLVAKLHASLTVRMRHIPFLLRLAGFGLLVVALARPQMGHTEQEVTTHGVDIMLVFDVSTSMRALDFKPNNRFFVAKETIKKFIQKREHDRIGLVIFAGRSFTKCPLTLDYAIIAQFLDDIKMGDIEDGTAIGTAIATAANRLKQSPAKSRIMILLTDGANNRGEITPIVAARAAGELGIKIYTIGIGRDGKVPYPVELVDPWSGKVVRQEVRMIDSDLDEQGLADIAGATNGVFYRAHDAKKLEEIYDTIDKLEKTEIKTTSYTTWSERFFPWLAGGCIVLLLELILRHTRFRRIP